MLFISNCLSVLQLVNGVAILHMQMDWQKSKKAIHEDDTLLTTGEYKTIILIFLDVLIQPYWFLSWKTYQDTKYNEFTLDLYF
jgi:hypothetical protein